MLHSRGTSTPVYRQTLKYGRVASYLADAPCSFFRSVPPACWRKFCARQKADWAINQTPPKASVQPRSSKDNESLNGGIRIVRHLTKNIYGQQASTKWKTKKAPPTDSIQPRGSRDNESLNINIRKVRQLKKDINKERAFIKWKSQHRGPKDNESLNNSARSFKVAENGVQKQSKSHERVITQAFPTTSAQIQGSKDNGSLKNPTRNVKWLKSGVGRQIASILPTTLEMCQAAVTSEVEPELLCSFSWATDTFSIYVPGSPPEWTPLALPLRLPADEGVYFIDQNAARVPSCPYIPFFKALQVMHPSYNLDSIDIIANRGSLRRLLEFMDNRLSKDFRIDLKLVQNTLIMIRRDRHHKERPKNAQEPGWGRTFEEMFTSPKPGLQKSSGHHRSIRYTLGDLNCVVQFEVDACYDKSKAQETKKSVKTSENEQDAIPDAPIKEAKRKVRFARPPTESRAQNKLAVRRAGSVIPASQLAEIKTRKEPSKSHVVLPQLWFGRTPQLITGIRESGKGVFNRVHIRDYTPKFQTWEMDNQDKLRKLASLLQQLRMIVKEAGGCVCSVVFDRTVKPPQLVVSSSTRKMIVPQEFLSEFWGL